MSWYALNVIGRQEAFVIRALREAHLLAYTPQHVTEAKFAKRKATRSRPLAAGLVRRPGRVPARCDPLRGA